MATQKQIPGPMFEPLADLGQKYAAQGEALRKQIIDEWNETYQSTKRHLRNAWRPLSLADADRESLSIRC